MLTSVRKQRLVLGPSAALTIALVVMLGAIEIYTDYQKTVEDAFARLENLARIAEETVSGRMRTIDVMLDDVARESLAIAEAADEKSLLSYMKARVESLDEVRTISITDANGRIIYSTRSELIGFDASQRAYFKQPLAAADRSRLHVTGPIQASLGTVILTASRARNLVDAGWQGVVVASLPPAYFAGILDTTRPQQDGFATLLGIEGTIIARSPDQEKFAGKNIAKGPAHSAHVASGQRMTRALVTTETEGRKRLVVSRTTDVPELVVAVGWSHDAVLAEWGTKSLIKASVLGLLTIMAIAVLRRLSQHEGALLAQRDFARQLIETANVMIVGLDRTGTVHVFNGAAEQTTGYRKDEIIGLSWFDVMLPGDIAPRAADEFLRLQGDGKAVPRHVEGPIITRDGRERLISWQNSPVAGQEVVSMSFGVDMTDRLRAERELVASQRFIRAITDNMPGMVAYWDADMRNRFANRSYLEWFGKTPDEMAAITIPELLGEPLFTVNEPRIRTVLSGEKQSFERTLISASGQTAHVWAHYIPDIEATGKVAGFLVLATDITPLKRKELELRTMSERLSLATRAGGVGVWDLDLDTRKLIWDDRMFQLYQIDPATTDHVYDMWRSACHPDDLPRVEAELAAALNGEQEFDSEFRIVTPDGAVRHIKAAATVDRDDGGKPLRMIGVNWDITAIRANEAALDEAKAAAEQATRAKSEFLANMSHEIRTPLTAVLGLAHLLEHTRLTAEQRDFVAKIRVAGRSLLSVINDILDFSKVEAGRLDLEPAEFLLPDLLDTISAIVSVNASAKHLKLTVAAMPDVPIGLVGDALRLQQILINLTGNAVKFTEQGEVALRVERVGTDGSRTVLRFSVSDTGIGIAPEALPSLFTAFSQADCSTTRRYGGSGLGLAISKKLVERMGGEIGVDSQPGHGSTFWVTIPFDLATVTDVRRSSAGALGVLIADDDETARQAIAAAAASLGWTVETVGSGGEALDRARERLRAESPFDVLILDWKMPGMDGLAVSRMVRTISGLKQSPVVIVVTAHSREALLRAPGAEAIDTVLVKPVTGSSLLDAVMDARARRSRRTDVPATDPGRPAVGPRLDGVRLLVVEDNTINQEVAKRVLELEGAEVTIATDGQQAVDRLAAAPDGFDVVLMDIQMPVMDGYHATTQIRRDLGLAGLPIIALTAGALSAERDRARDAGMNDFIAKPFDVDQMVRTIRQHVTLSAPVPQRAQPDAAVPSPSDPFGPDIPGLDMRQAKLRLGGDRDLFRSLLARLDEGFAGVAAQVGEHLAARRTEDAAHCLHTLRGAAGNVGAVAVASLASTLEAAILDGHQDRIPELLHHLDATLGGLMAAIRGQEASGPGSADDVTPQPYIGR